MGGVSIRGKLNAPFNHEDFMATLELQVNCLCLFVPDPENNVVHILMPGTKGHAGHDGHNGHAESHEHVVRMLHHSFEKEEEKLLGRPMEGWALILGPEQASADLTLLPPQGASQGGALPNLSELTGKKVPRALVGPEPGDRVAARITLRSGRVTRMASEATWEIGGHPFPLAHQVTWQMSDVDHALEWQGLNGRPNTEPKPLETLQDLEPEDDLGYKLRIFHVTREGLPPKGGILKPEVMRAHYRAFYPLLGENDPGDDLLPRIKGKHIHQVNCGGGQAAL
jgi:hypothetical protein